ncbi:tail protein [Lactococcus phage AM11]|uniref:Tail protein n=1 Tax=Lactococcus phage AM11 TaxID=1965468 RepID=A0A1W6JMW7_9CAUD|nr:tail protein [Lactococcus phage AM11]
MLKDLGLDLDLTRSKRPFKVQLALPSKVITQNISNINTANISDVKLNSLPHFEFEIPYLVESKSKGVTDNIEYIKNPDLDSIKEEKLIKLTWYGGRVNWFRIITIEKNDSSEGITTKISCDSLESELRTTNVTIDGTGIGAEEYFKKTLEQSPWKLGHVSNKLKNTYRTFSEQDKQTRYEAIQSGIEAYGAITDFDGETRTLNLLTIDELRVFRGVVLKRENYANSIDISSTSEEIVTRMYAKGNEDLDISSANPTGMRYIEDFSYFIQPFKRDEHKNVLHHSDYMSDDLAHALLDLMELQKVYNPKIDNLQKLINQGYVDLTKKMSEKADFDGEMITLQALLDTAKSTSNKSLTAQRESEIIAKQKQVDDKSAEIDSINKTIEVWNKTIVDYQEIISTNSFRADLVEELKLFVYEKDFSDDRYIDAKELYKATVEEFEKYQKPTRSFKTDLASFINSIESKKYHGRLEIGEEVKIKSNKLEEEYTSIIIGYSGDLVSGDFQLEISDNMDDIDALDRLATIIYQAESSSSILENNKYKWNNIVEVKDEVTAWRDKEIKAVNNRITAGANESITLDNRGMMVRNPDFPNEVIIIQSGVVALSKDNGKTWNTSITPNGVIAETLIGKILAGNNLIITNDSGSFVIDNTGLTVNMDSIKIMSGHEGDPKNIIDSWNKLLLTYDEIANDNLINEYEKKQLKNQWTKITDIHSSMISSFMKGRGKPTKENPYPDEYNEYVTAYEDLNKYLNQTQQSDGYSILDDANMTKTTTIDSGVFKEKFINYDKKKQALESIISFDYTRSEIKTLETGISLNYVKNDNVVTALNLSEEGVKIDGKLLEINSKTEFNADLVMNAGVIKGKDDGIIIDLNTGEIKLNKKITVGANSNLVTEDDIAHLKGNIVSTLSNDFITIFTDPNGSSGNYDYASTEMNVYRDGVLDTSNWTFSVERNNNVVYTVSKNTVKVLSTKTDSETIVIVATLGKETLKKEFKIKKYKDTSGNINRWMMTSDSLRKTPYDEWVNTPITVIGNQELVGGSTTEYLGRYKIYESKDGGLNYFLKYTSSSDESIVTYKPFDNDITHVKLQFYLAGSTLNLIDEQILPVIIERNKVYTHTAYAYNADGTDRFTTVYPRFNLLSGTAKFDNFNPNSSNNSVSTITKTKISGINNTVMDVKTSGNAFAVGFYTQKGYNITAGQTITISFIAKASSNTSLFVGFEHFPNGYKMFTISTKWELYTYTFTATTSGTPSFVIYGWDMVAGQGFQAYNPKVEQGSTVTPYMPLESEATTADYPSYIGTYSDDKVSDSTNPSAYTWSLFKGQDSNAYTAYSWSSDGADRFSTVYPNLNLLHHTTFKNHEPIPQQYASIAIKNGGVNNKPYISVSYNNPTENSYTDIIQWGDWGSWGFDKESFKTSTTYTFSFYLKGSGTIRTHVYPSIIDTSSGNGLVDGKVIGLSPDGQYDWNLTSEWVRHTYTFTTKSSMTENQNFLFRLFTGNSVDICLPKVEEGSIATPWTPSQNESQDQWQDAIPMYVGVGDKDSQNPTDYRWQLNPRYVQASSDSGLSNKAGLDDLASVADTANDALVQAQNAVSNEDYTSWLEHDYQTTINNLQDVSAQNQEDINNVDDRTTIVEGFYEGMKVKWNFIDESFTFSEEGMFISNAQSKIAIQVTSDKIVFWDNNVDVAFITGEVLNIQKGVFLESATIGNHLITKFSDDSPVTIIRYVGGIT